MAARRHALLVHGLSGDSSAWWRVRGWLEDDGWTVTTPDLRGHGLAAPGDGYALDDYAADLRALHPEGAGSWDVVIGHSLGGASSILAASAEPDWTRRLVLLDPVVAVPAHAMPSLTASQVAETRLTRDAVAVANPRWDPRDVDAKAQGIARVRPGVVAATFADTGDWNVADEARELPVPTLILGGDPEVFALFFPALGALLAKANPLLDYRVVPGAGHSPHRDEPEAVHELLRGWLGAAE